MDKDKIKYYRKKLLKKKKQLIKSITNFNRESKKNLKNSTGELSSYDNHPADQGSNTFDREKDRGINDNNLLLLQKVNNSLKAIKDNKYGLCINCNKEIENQRLEVLPYTNLCKKCSEKEEVNDQ